MQAKDIPDEDALAVIRAVAVDRRAATRSDLERAMPQVPPKVLLAKTRSMVRRGLIDGCTCGCRGGFEVVGEPVQHRSMLELVEELRAALQRGRE